MLHGLGLAIPGPHLRPAHRLSRGQQHLAALRSRRERKKPRKRLTDACRAYGIEGWERIDKEDHRQGHRRRQLAREIQPARRHRLLRGRRAQRRCSCCARSCVDSALLPADVERVLHWSNYSAKAIALIQARGMPIDMPLWNLVQENKAAVIARACCGNSIRARQRRPDLHAGRRVELRAF